MAIRIEGTRPVDAAPTIATNQPRTSGDNTKPPEQHERAVTPEQSASAPESVFKPFALSFSFDGELNRVVVKVIDPVTDEVLREIPSEEVLETLRQLRRGPGGLVDEQV